MLEDLIRKNRSFRRFNQAEPVSLTILRELVGLAREVPSAANRQPLKYILVADSAMCDRVFPNLAWAGYLADWDGPGEGEQPTGYVVILLDEEISETIDCDHGIATQSILLGAAERGLGGCIIGSIDRDALSQVLELPGHLRILLVLALGVPAEAVELEEVGPGGDIRYYRDDTDVHHVPKRTLSEMIVAEYGG
jgi:nitroreductase